jgi:DNA-binding response OmpR family regulator
MTQQQPGDVRTTTPARVLVIDDEPQIRRFLDISLRAQGYRVELAETGAAGLAALATRGSDPVILHLQLHFIATFAACPHDNRAALSLVLDAMIQSILD